MNDKIYIPIRSEELTTDSLNDKFGSKECINAGMFSGTKVTSYILRANEVEVLTREESEIVTKQIAFRVVNG